MSRIQTFPTTVLILAGGLGTRLRAVLSDGVPKPMAPIGNRPFLEYLLNYWIDKGACSFVISVGYCSDMIIKYFGRSYEGRTIRYIKETHPLGTGGALLASSVDMQAPFFAVNGDTFFDIDVEQLIFTHELNNADWTIALFRSNETARYMGVSLNQRGQILGFERTGLGTLLVNGGTYLIKPSALRGFTDRGVPMSLERELLPLIKERGARIFGDEQTGQFIDIGIPEDYDRSQRLLKFGGGHVQTDPER